MADIQVCSNGARTSDGYQYSPSDFLLADEQNRTYAFWNVQIGARSPNLTDSLFGNLAEGMCVRGWLTFELPPETKIKAAAYAPYDGDPLLWLPRPR